MNIQVYYEHWVRQWIAFDADLQDVDYTGPVIWADTKEAAVHELVELLEDEGVAA